MCYGKNGKILRNLIFTQYVINTNKYINIDSFEKYEKLAYFLCKTIDVQTYYKQKFQVKKYARRSFVM